jgi:hypothetical protein
VDSVFATANLEAVKVHVLPAERYLKDLAKPGDTRIASHQMRRQISGLMLRSTARLQDFLARRCPGFHRQSLFCCTAHPQEMDGLHLWRVCSKR